jgi:hypothetical protein
MNQRLKIEMLSGKGLRNTEEVFLCYLSI